MRILIINSVCGIRSTGRICTNIAKSYINDGHKVRIAYGRENVPGEYNDIAVRIGNKFDIYIGAFKARIFDNEGFNCKKSTRKFLLWADKFNPDLLWLHNLHGYYINVKMLFDWIKSRPNMQVKWTLHDCWAFTGHCSHFTVAQCDQWKVYCTKCDQSKRYPKAYRDNCKQSFICKKEAFTGVKNLTIIVPSQWLANLVKQSFLKEYPVEVHYNTIDTDVFKPTPSNFRERFNLQDKRIVLGVASVWDDRKGLSDFFKLSDMLDETYVIVLVGLDKKQIKKLPDNIVGIERTNNTKELAEIYTAADIFVNLTHEDNYPTVNLEAQACGTPCITYRTGGSIESVSEENVIVKGDIIALLKRIGRICQ